MLEKIYSELSLPTHALSEKDELNKLLLIIDKTQKVSNSIPRYYDSTYNFEFNIVCITFTEDGSALACGLKSGKLYYKNLLNPTKTFIINAHERIEQVDHYMVVQDENVAHVNSVSFDKENKFIATGSEDCSIKIWDIESQKEVCLFSGHKFAVKIVNFAMKYSEKILISIDYFGEMKFWSLKDKKESFTIKLHEDSPITLKCHPRYTSLASISKSSIKIFSITSKKEEFSLKFDTKTLKSAYIASDLTKFWYLTEGKNQLRSFTIKDSNDQLEIEFNEEPIYFSFNSSLNYCSVLFKGRVVIFNVMEWREEFNYIEKSSLNLNYCMSFSENGIFACSLENDLFISEMFPVFEEILFAEKVNFYSWFTNDSEKIIFSQSNTDISFFDIKTKSEDFKIPTGAFVEQVEFSPNLEYLAMIIREDNLKLVRMSDKYELSSFKLPRFHNAFCFTSDSTSILYHIEDSTISIFHIPSLTETKKLNFEKSYIKFMKFTKSGEHFITYCDPDTIKITNWQTNKQSSISTQQNLKFFCLHPTDTYLATTQNKKILIYNLSLSRAEFELIGHQSEIKAISFENQGKYLASASKDHSIRVWNFNDRREEFRLNLQHELMHVCFSPDSRYLSFSNTKSRLYLWDFCLKRKSQVVTFVEDSQVYLLYESNGKKVLNNPDQPFEKQSFGVCGIEISDFRRNGDELTLLDENKQRWVKFSLDSKEVCGDVQGGLLWKEMGVDSRNRFLGLDPSSVYQSRDYGVVEFDNVWFCLAVKRFENLGPGFFRVQFSNIKVTGLHVLAHLGEGQVIKTLLSKYKPEFFTDIFSHSPLFYCITGRHQQTTDTFLEHFIDSAESRDHILLINLNSLQADFNSLLINSSQYINGFLETCFFTTNERPVFAHPSSSLPILTSLSSSSNLISDYCSSDQSQNQIPLNLKSFYIKVPIKIGSKASISAMEGIISCLNEEIFRTQFIKFYLRLRWNKSFLIIVSYCVLQWLNILFVTLLVKNSINMYIYTILLSIINCPLLLWEVLQLKSLKLNYFQNISNLFSSIRLILTFTWLGFKFNTFYSRWFTWVVLLFNLFEGLVGFKAFDSTRYYLRLLSTSLNNIKFFVLLFIYTTFSFALLSSGSPDKDKHIELNFQSLWMISYGLVYGDYDIMNSTTFDTQYVTLALAIFINIILMLNLIISILGDAFDEFQLKSEIYDCREMANVLIEVDQVLSVRRVQDEFEFLHVCMNAYAGGQGFWKGKVLDFRTYVDELKGFIDQSLNQNVEKMQTGLDAKLVQVNKRVDEISTKLEQNMQKNFEIESKLNSILSILSKTNPS